MGSFQLNAANSYQTFGIDGKVYARGNLFYNSASFYQDFGIPVKAINKSPLAFAEILAKKIRLKVYEKELSLQDEDKYIENAIIEESFTSSCFKFSFHKK